MNNTNPYNIDLTSFLAELGLKDLSPEKKDEYSQKLLQLLEARISMKIEDRLSEEDLAIMESKSQAEATEYLDSKGINIAEISAHAGQELREELLTSMSYAEGLIENLANPEPNQDQE